MANASGPARDILAGVDDFADTLKKATQQKRDKETREIAALRDQVATLDNAVESEAKTRAETASTLRAWAQTQLDATRARLLESLASSHSDTLNKIAALEARVAALEVSFAADHERTVALVNQRNADLVAALDAFSARLEAEKASRAAREAALSDRLSSAEHKSQQAWAAERHEREQVYMAAKARLEEAIEARESADGRFQTTALGEIAGLRNGLAAERAAREAEDARLSEQLASAVSKLQASLALLASDDVDV